jgi:hypothetical protein
MSFPPGTEMFQFPGFASCDLYIQSQDTCLTPLLTSPEEEDSRQVSGGLPHSEIDGSKPIPGSPSLIAGYHVLHRLLLPRHPPNALLALDPTQRRTGRRRARARHLEAGPLVAPASPASASPHARSQPSGRKSYMSRAPEEHAVSVLDLEQSRLGRPRTSLPRTAPALPHAGEPAAPTFLSLNDVKTSRSGPDGPRDRTGQHATPKGRACWPIGSRPNGCGGEDGGACRDRTDDPLLAKQALSQLS